jgi:hypothetical protein
MVTLVGTVGDTSGGETEVTTGRGGVTVTPLLPTGSARTSDVALAATAPVATHTTTQRLLRVTFDDCTSRDVFIAPTPPTENMFTRAAELKGNRHSQRTEHDGA